MDTKDKNQEIASSDVTVSDTVTGPEVMLPDTTTAPVPPEMLELSAGTELGAGADGANGTDSQGTIAKKAEKSPTPLQDSIRRLRRDRRAMISLGIIVTFMIIPIIGPFIYQHIGGTYNSLLNGPVSP